MEQTLEPMDKIALQLGPLSITWYGLIIGCGLLLGLYLALQESERRGISKDTFMDVILYAVPAAIICARIYYVIFQWDYYAERPGDIIKIWEGGIAIHGAIIGSLLTGYIFARIKKISFWKLVDVAAPSLLLGQAIGRWGNFMNQEAYGGEVSRSFLEGLFLPDFIINQMYIGGAYHHPTFLYESLWNFAGVALLLILRRTGLRVGEIFLSYVIWYSVGRYFIEGMRTDSLMLTSDLRMAQVISIVSIVAALVLWLYRRTKGYSEKRYLES